MNNESEDRKRNTRVGRYRRNDNIAIVGGRDSRVCFAWPIHFETKLYEIQSDGVHCETTI